MYHVLTGVAEASTTAYVMIQIRWRPRRGVGGASARIAQRAMRSASSL